MGDWRETTVKSRSFEIGMQPRPDNDCHSPITVESRDEGYLTLRQDGDCIMMGSRQLADFVAVVRELRRDLFGTEAEPSEPGPARDPICVACVEGLDWGHVNPSCKASDKPGDPQ